MAETEAILNNKDIKDSKDSIELAETVTVPRSTISVSRETGTDVEYLDVKTLEELYATVPEVSRTIDLRAASIISRGFEITARDNSTEAQQYASICLKVLNDSGGVSWVEQWHKNADLYGNGYEELAEDGGKIVKLVHKSPLGFGYELETYVVDGTKKTRIKLDPQTQEPIGYASYKFDSNANLWVTDKPIAKEKISHLKYKVVGDALYGISIIQPMQGSLIRKIKIEAATEAAARLVSSPKIVISGDFADNEAAKTEAKEAANLDVSDVVVLQGEKKFEIIKTGDTNLPQLREMFISNITTASGIPRPVLTSDGNDINKATMEELMKHMKELMRSNMNKIKQQIENEIFYRIGESWGINNFQNIIPYFDFPEDPTTEQETIVREEKKAATITSLSNAIQILANVQAMGGATGSGNTGTGNNSSKNMQDAIDKTIQIYINTLNTFMVNNDQDTGKVEEKPIVDTPTKKGSSTPSSTGPTTPSSSVGTKSTPTATTPTSSSTTTQSLNLDATQNGVFTGYSAEDAIDTIRQKDILLKQHELVHKAFQYLKEGNTILDAKTHNVISMMQLIDKHNFYVNTMKELGIHHPLLDYGKELDEIYMKYQQK